MEGGLFEALASNCYSQASRRSGVVLRFQIQSPRIAFNSGIFKILTLGNGIFESTLKCRSWVMT